MPHTIQSSISTAQTYTSSLAHSGLEQINPASRDAFTTVAGNDDAHQVIELSGQGTEEVSAVLSQGVSNIHSVASEFEALDQELAQGGV